MLYSIVGCNKFAVNCSWCLSCIRFYILSKIMAARGKKKRTLGPIDTNEKTVTLLENHRKLGTGCYYPITGRTKQVYTWIRWAKIIASQPRSYNISLRKQWLRGPFEVKTSIILSELFKIFLHAWIKWKKRTIIAVTLSIRK